MSRTDEILKKVGTLPPLPTTAIKLMNIINDPRSTLNDIVDTIKYDQAITGQVLRLCNSAYFGLSRTVTSLSDAMLCLGTVKVLQLVMSVHANALLSRKQIGYGLERGMLWKHSVAVALAASAVAQKLNPTQVNLTFTAGLLHDIGKVILNEYVAKDFLEIVRRVNEQRLSFVEAETQVLGVSHEDIGAQIAANWKLPEAIVQSIQYHHNPDAVKPANVVVDAVYLANCICLLLGIGLGEDGLYYRADPMVMQRHQLQEHDLEAIGMQTMVELKRVEQLFSDGAIASARETVSV